MGLRSTARETSDGERLRDALGPGLVGKARGVLFIHLDDLDRHLPAPHGDPNVPLVSQEGNSRRRTRGIPAATCIYTYIYICVCIHIYIYMYSHLLFFRVGNGHRTPDGMMFLYTQRQLVQLVYTQGGCKEDDQLKPWDSMLSNKGFAPQNQVQHLFNG